MLKPCAHRSVTNDGSLVCAKITRGTRETSPQICEACPAASIDCQNLRFSLEQRAGGQLIVRYGSGRTEVWEGEAAGVRFERAACSALCIPLSGVQTCAGCTLRLPCAVPGAPADGAAVSLRRPAAARTVTVAARS